MGADRYLPVYDFVEHHATRVAAPPEVVDDAVRALDLHRSPIVRLLFALRGMPREAVRIDGLARMGFRLLEHEPGRSLVLGLIGRFWRIGGGICRYDPVEFADFDEPGWAKATWSFTITPMSGGRTRLETETRVRCTDARSRRRFRAYWLVVRPFSGLIRRVALREIKRQAEAGTKL